MSHPISAWAACNALGSEASAISDALRAGAEGLRPVDWPQIGMRPYGKLPFELPALPSTLAAFDCRQARIAGWLAQQIAPAVQGAVQRYGARRVGTIIGTSTGGIGHTEDALAHVAKHAAMPPDFDLWRRHQMSATTEVVRHMTGIDGPQMVVSTACSSSGKVFGAARRWLSANVVDAVLVGGIDSLSRLTVYGFSALDVLSDVPCRPFGRDRKGINLGEAGALLLIERSGDGPVHLWGVGESNDAHHMSAPHPQGLGAALAMRRALDDAGVDAGAIGHVHAHGTATVQGDQAEAAAIADVLGEAAIVWGSKGAVGHTLGAAGATEAVLSIELLAAAELPATLGAEPVDDSLPIDVVATPRPMPGGLVLSNSFAFGGSNVAVVLGGPP